jgi:hypothetical protein
MHVGYQTPPDPATPHFPPEIGPKKLLHYFMYYFSQPEVNFLHNGRKFITTLDLLGPSSIGEIEELAPARRRREARTLFSGLNALLVLFRLEYLHKTARYRHGPVSA